MATAVAGAGAEPVAGAVAVAGAGAGAFAVAVAGAGAGAGAVAVAGAVVGAGAGAVAVAGAGAGAEAGAGGVWFDFGSRPVPDALAHGQHSPLCRHDWARQIAVVRSQGLPDC